MEFKYSMMATLEARFTDMDECHDVATHGADTGVSNFTYTWEINEFFNEFEDELQDYYYEIFGDTWLTDMSYGITSLNELRAKMVWGLIENYCGAQFDELVTA